jgi:hypothetical protein
MKWLKGFFHSSDSSIYPSMTRLGTFMGYAGGISVAILGILYNADLYGTAALVTTLITPGAVVKYKQKKVEVANGL